MKLFLLAQNFHGVIMTLQRHTIFFSQIIMIIPSVRISFELKAFCITLLNFMFSAFQCATILHTSEIKRLHYRFSSEANFHQNVFLVKCRAPNRVCLSCLRSARSGVFKKALPFVVWIKLILKTPASKNKNPMNSIKKRLKTRKSATHTQARWSKWAWLWSSEKAKRRRNTTNHLMWYPLLDVGDGGEIHDCTMVCIQAHHAMENRKKGGHGESEEKCVFDVSALRHEPIMIRFFSSSFLFRSQHTLHKHRRRTTLREVFRFRLAMISITGSVWSNINTMLLSELWWW